MLLEIILALVLGVIIGSLTGIAPGIHINLVATLFLSFSTVLLGIFQPIILVVFLVSMAITHTFVDFIPSIFLGAPDEDDTALAILPGHSMLIQGKAYSAVVYTIYGGLAGLVLILLFSPLFFYFLPIVYPYAQRIMPFILILTSFFLIYLEKSSRIWALLIFLLSGIIGLTTLNLPILNEPLLPLFTGLFGVSSLISSIKKKNKIPNQEITPLKDITLPIKSLFKSISASALASPLCSFLPGLGSGQAAIIGSELVDEEKSYTKKTEKLNRKEFLILLGSINTIVTGLSFITLYSIGKARTGIAVTVGKILNLSVSDIVMITLVILISGILASLVSLFIAKEFSKIISKVNYSLLSTAVLFILLAINLYFSSWIGLLVLAVSSALGLLCIYSGVRRTHMLGCLVIPAIMLYLL